MFDFRYDICHNVEKHSTPLPYMVVQEIDGTYILSLQNGVETSIEKKHTNVTENHCTAVL